MSARSPRASLSGASSAEVAEDFAESLKDLQINNKYEISNLTIIAKENTEHAQAISRALEKHIKTTAPSRKLPALYVLDSIVKNVGTPYTLYLASNLYSTFMDAYTLVDGQTRRLMEGVLKTWKEPITGSIDPRPVFPLETVRPIENALIKARTAALQSQRGLGQQPYQNTPTPPQNNSFVGPPPGNMAQQPIYAHEAPKTYSPLPVNMQPTPTPQQFQPFPAQPSHNEVEEVKRELANLVLVARAEFSTNPFDHGLQTRLQALLQLEQVLEKRALNETELRVVRNQLSAMSGGSSLAAARPTPPPPQPTSQWQAPLPPPTSFPQIPTPQLNGLAQPYSSPPSTQPQPAVPLFPPSALSGLQALLANNQKPSTPQMRAAAPVLQNASHTQLQNVQQQAAASPAINGADLLAALAKNGLLPKPPAIPAIPSPMPPIPSLPVPTANAPESAPTPSTVDLLRSLQGKIQPIPSQSNTPTLPPIPATNQAVQATTTTTTTTMTTTTTPRMPMTGSLLKTFNPGLVYNLYESQPNQCNNCGRRFAANDAGRAKKERHLDWHFRTNQRLADSNPAAHSQHRLDFPDELKWVHARDFDVSTAAAGDDAPGTGENSVGPGGSAASRQRRPEDESVPAPPGVTKNTCSICFEDMKSAYNEETQQWVFMNAKRHGSRIVHATCLAELQKGSAAAAAAAAAPDNINTTTTTTTNATAAAAVAPSISNPVGGTSGAGVASLAALLEAARQTQQRQRSATPDSSLGKRKADGPPLGSVGGGGGGGARLRTE